MRIAPRPFRKYIENKYSNGKKIPPYLQSLFDRHLSTRRFESLSESDFSPFDGWHQILADDLSSEIILSSHKVHWISDTTWPILVGRRSAERTYLTITQPTDIRLTELLQEDKIGPQNETEN